MIEEEREIKERCIRLIAAFKKLPVVRLDRAVLTPNDAATIADLAQWILEYQAELAPQTRILRAVTAELDTAKAENKALRQWMTKDQGDGDFLICWPGDRYEHFDTRAEAEAALDAALKGVQK